MFTMINTIGGIVIMVSDQAQAVKFYTEKIGFDITTLSAKESCTYHQLDATYHKDPFDRMLIWQAITNDYILVSADSDVKKYTSEGLRIYQER